MKPLRSTVVKNAGRIAAAAAVVATTGGALLSLAACNTTEGVGKDIESAGEGIKDAARKAKD